MDLIMVLEVISTIFAFVGAVSGNEVVVIISVIALFIFTVIGYEILYLRGK